MQNKEKICPYCRDPYNVRGYTTHEIACSKRYEDRMRKIAYERQHRGQMPGQWSNMVQKVSDTDTS